MFKDPAQLDNVRPYVSRALQDDDLQRNVLRAFSAARRVYEDLSGEAPKGAARKVISPKERVHQDLDTAVSNLSEAVMRMSGRKPVSSKRRNWRPFGFAAAAAFILFNPATGPSTRKWLKDHLVGSEEEFDYAAPDY